MGRANWTLPPFPVTRAPRRQWILPVSTRQTPGDGFDAVGDIGGDGRDGGNAGSSESIVSTDGTNSVGLVFGAGFETRLNELTSIGMKALYYHFGGGSETASDYLFATGSQNNMLVSLIRMSFKLP